MKRAGKATLREIYHTYFKDRDILKVKDNPIKYLKVCLGL